MYFLGTGDRLRKSTPVTPTPFPLSPAPFAPHPALSLLVKPYLGLCISGGALRYSDSL